VQAYFVAGTFGASTRTLTSFPPIAKAHAVAEHEEDEKADEQRADDDAHEAHA
jgi:hypothetical protein